MRYKFENIPCCAQCRNSENKINADFYVVGKTNQNRPYRANLCDSHLEILSCEEYDLTVTTTYITQENVTLKELDDITRQVTSKSFCTFDELINAEGGYEPTIDCSVPIKKFLADAYDKVQSARGDKRRVYRKIKSR